MRHAGRERGARGIRAHRPSDRRLVPMSIGHDGEIELPLDDPLQERRRCRAVAGKGTYSWGVAPALLAWAAMGNGSDSATRHA